MSKKPLTRRPAPPPYFVFADGVLAGKTDRQAAIDAGYSPASAASRALAMKSHPEVIAAIEAGKARLRKAADFDADAAYRELDELIAEAKGLKQMNAAVKAAEAKYRLLGLLDKPNPLLGISALDALAQAQGRLDAYRAQQRAEVEDATVVETDDATARAIAHIDIFG